MTLPRIPIAAAPAVVVYLAVTAALVAAGVQRTGGPLIYPLDDAYVHMAIAKHTALDGVWGVTSERFTSASSSPLWTGLLAAIYALTGVSDAVPLVLNVVFGTVLLMSVCRLLIDARMPAAAAVPWSLIVLFAGTVPTITLIGMEHTLHALATVWFLWLAARHAARGTVSMAALTIAAMLVTAVRYEGLFAIAAVMAALAVMRRWRDAMLIGAAGVAPVLGFGLWSIEQGGMLLPTTVLLDGVWTLAPPVLFSVPHLAAVTAAVVGLSLLPAPHRRRDERWLLALMFTTCVLLHLEFARTGWFFRYEAYLMVCGLVAAALLSIGVEWPGIVRQEWRAPAAPIALAVLALIAVPIARGGVSALRQVPGAMSNIHEQQYQAARFLDEYYSGRRVAVNDAGAIGYYANVKLFDVSGLASGEIAALKRRGEYTSASLGELASRDGVDIAVIDPTSLDEYGGVPGAWQKVGEWRVADNLGLGQNGMSFFDVRPDGREALARRLVQYADRLPSTVQFVAHSHP